MADRAVPLFVIDPSVIQVHRIVVQQLLEFRRRYLVHGEVLPVLFIPIKFDRAGHNSILYRNVYTLPPPGGVGRCFTHNVSDCLGVPTLKLITETQA